MGVTILCLSDELLLSIIEQVAKDDTKSLLSLCTVCQRILGLTNTILYKTIPITSSNLQHERPSRILCQEYTSEANIIAHSRHLIIEGVLDWTIFATLLSKLKHLESIRWFYWNTPFPTIVRETLQTRWPGVRIYMEKLTIGSKTDRKVQQADENLLHSLAEFSNIYSMKAEVNYEHGSTMRLLKHVLLKNSGINVLHITLPRNAYGHFNLLTDGLGVYDLSVREGEMLGLVKELVYETRGGPYSRPEFIPISFFNWTNIRHLQVRGYQTRIFIRALKHQKLTLRSLVINGDIFTEELDDCEDLFSKVQGLVTLQLINPTGRMPITAIALLGKTLKHLTIRHHRDNTSPHPSTDTYISQPYSPQELNDLREALPHLSSLTLNVAFRNTTLYDTLASLSQFPNLDSLTIIMEPSQASSQPLPHYLTDVKTVSHMCSYLIVHKAGIPFTNIEVMLGGLPRFLGFDPFTDMRPALLFSYQKNRQKVGDFVRLEDDSCNHLRPQFKPYFDPARLDSTRGQTFPRNLEAIIAAGRESEVIMANFPKTLLQNR